MGGTLPSKGDGKNSGKSRGGVSENCLFNCVPKHKRGEHFVGAYQKKKNAKGKGTKEKKGRGATSGQRWKMLSG